MPKLKTHKGLAKRVKVTANGKFKVRRAGGSHLMSGWSPKRARNLGKAAFISPEFEATARKMLGLKNPK
ncbi:MAG: 50S ribosomal protein L35 [Phycisphaerae bacterium]|jgi:large subunit ribosomal protein L35